jgi:YfiH family protein
VRGGAPGQHAGVEADAAVTSVPGAALAVQTADCVPIALAREDGTALAVLHAGWRGLLEGIVDAGVAALGGTPRAAVGPAIGPCCYEVGPEVADPFRRRFGADVVSGRMLDLWTAAERALREAGVATVERFDICTSCNPELFFSHRRDAGVTGRQGVVGVVAG